ncbi:MAG: hypothetical protein P8Z68_05860 [Kineosporiaceae bacterium]|jgi:hypothetical protein
MDDGAARDSGRTATDPGVALPKQAGSGVGMAEPKAPEIDLHGALTALDQARDALAAGDADGAIRTLRSVPEGLPLGDEGSLTDIAGIVEGAARLTGFTALLASAAAVRATPHDPQVLYEYGYRCVEHGAAWVAIPALALAVARAPESTAARMELVSALEAESRYAEAVTVLAHGPTQQLWLGRYLLAFNSLMAGDVEGARQWYTRVGRPEQEQHVALAARLDTMLARMQTVTGATRLDGGLPAPDPRGVLSEHDLRGWHFVLNGGVLTTLSPYGFTEGMNGRYAFLNETLGGCRRGLERVSTVLGVAGRRPAAVALLPDRSSRILGLAAAELLGLPAVEWSPGASDALVPAFTLSGADPDLLAGLRTATDQVLVEHATCWTEPPPLAADITTLLHQVVTAPWEAHRRPLPGGGGWSDEPADDRPEAEIAQALIRAVAEAPEGDGQTPADHEGALSDFVTLVAPRWGTGTARDRVWSPGPVPSSRFW